MVMKARDRCLANEGMVVITHHGDDRDRVLVAAIALCRLVSCPGLLWRHEAHAPNMSLHLLVSFGQLTTYLKAAPVHPTLPYRTVLYCTVEGGRKGLGVLFTVWYSV